MRTRVFSRSETRRIIRSHGRVGDYRNSIQYQLIPSDCRQSTEKTLKWYGIPECPTRRYCVGRRQHCIAMPLSTGIEKWYCLPVQSFEYILKSLPRRLILEKWYCFPVQTLKWARNHPGPHGTVLEWRFKMVVLEVKNAAGFQRLQVILR